MKSINPLDYVDQLIKSRTILRHPFYVAWQRGELTRKQLATYAQIYYPHVAAFPKYLQSACNRADYPEVRLLLEQNLADEMSNPKTHPELWLDFAESLELERITVAETEPDPSAANIIDTFQQFSQKDAISALAALYAYESQQPEVSRQKLSGLHEFYGIDDPKAIAYFEVHAEADIEHREGERKAIEYCFNNGCTAEALTESTEAALNAYWGLLDGVCEEAGLSLKC